MSCPFLSPPLVLAGLYFHVPFREGPRTYDESYSVPFSGRTSEAYVEAVQRELRFYAAKYADDEPVNTLYAGGGRPSLLPLGDVRRVVQTVLEVFDASAFEEATAELNPADARLGYLNGLSALGFDRLSIEVLSFFPEDLDALAAPHTGQEAVRTVREARKVGINNLSVDLLFGWPGQPDLHWKANLQQVVRMKVPHVTLVEWTGPMELPAADAADKRALQNATDTAFAPPPEAASRPVVTEPTDADDRTPEEGNRPTREVDLARRLRFAMEFLGKEGYEQYDLTHFALPGHRSRHQENYTSHGNYLGVGPSAHTLWWLHRERQEPARRWSNVTDLDRYTDLLSQEYSPVAYRQTVDWRSLGAEYVMLQLRTAEGLDLRHLKAQYGMDLRAKKEDLLHRLVNHGLIEPFDSTHRVRLTLRGRLVADGVTERLLRDIS